MTMIMIMMYNKWIFFGGHTWNGAIWRHFNLNLPMQDRSWATSRNPIIIWVIGSNGQNYSKSMLTTGDRVQPCTVTYHQNNTEQVSSFKYLGIEVSQDGTLIFCHEWSKQKRPNTIHVYNLGLFQTDNIFKTTTQGLYTATCKSIWPSHQANTSLCTD